jgi:hypothetical protein
MDRGDASVGNLGAADWHAKSLPPGVPLTDIRHKRWSLFAGHFWSPILILKSSALDHNIAAATPWQARAMREFIPVASCGFGSASLRYFRGQERPEAISVLEPSQDAIA